MKPGCTFPLLALAVPNVPSLAAFVAMNAGSPTAAWAGGAASGLFLGAAWLRIADPLLAAEGTRRLVHRLVAGGFLVAIAALFPAWVRFGANDFARELRGKTPIVDVADAPRSEEGLLEVRGGVVRTDFSGVHRYERNHNALVAVVAPLVPPDWTPDRDVAVWAACIRRASEEASCARTFAVPRKLGSSETSDTEPYDLAMRDATTRRGVRSAPASLRLKLLEDPAVDAWAELGTFAVLLVLSNAAVLAATGRCLSRLMPRPEG